MSERKDSNGKALSKASKDAVKITPQYLDRYFDLETKVAEHLEQLGIERAAIGE